MKNDMLDITIDRVDRGFLARAGSFGYAKNAATSGIEDLKTQVSLMLDEFFAPAEPSGPAPSSKAKGKKP